MSKKISVYIHIPFCKKKCNYCAFNSKIGGEEEISNYVDALIAEILNSEPAEVTTIYFGGGTPSILNLLQIKKIFTALKKKFNFDANAEITIEINPGTVDENFLRGLRELGFNRLSIGVQSFSDRLLKIIGRIHDAKTAIETVLSAKKFFSNISLDLMYGLPSQTLAELESSVEIFSDLDVQHISIYGLEIEEGTKFFAEKDFLNLPSDETCSDMYDFITEKIPALGFERYEVSNFAKKNFESRHNVGYWTGREYFGFGAGAHSYKKNLRTSNTKNVADYIKKIRAGEKFFEVEEVVTDQAAIEEFCFLGLRMAKGISIKNFADRFGRNIFEIYGAVFEKYFKLNLLKVEGDRIFFTPHGFKVSNIILSDFLL